MTHQATSGEDAVLAWVRHGLAGCNEIAKEMGLTPGTVSKMARVLIEAGKLVKKGRDYALPPGAKAEEPAG